MRGRLVIGARVIVSPRGRVVFVVLSPDGRLVIRISRGGVAPINVKLIVIVMRVSTVLVVPIPTIPNESRALRKLLRFFRGAVRIASPERGRLGVSRGHPLGGGKRRITSAGQTFQLQSLQTPFIVPLGIRVSIGHVVILSLFRGRAMILARGRIPVHVPFLGIPCELIELLLRAGLKPEQLIVVSLRVRLPAEIIVKVAGGFDPFPVRLQLVIWGGLLVRFDPPVLFPVVAKILNVVVIVPLVAICWLLDRLLIVESRFRPARLPSPSLLVE